MGENRVKQFRDKTMSCIRVRRGSNQKEEPYLGENVHPSSYVLKRTVRMIGRAE